MQLTKDDIKHIADLSRLEIKDDEIENYRRHLVSILGYVEKLSEVNTDGVAEMAVGSSAINVWRTDEVLISDLSEREAALKAFPRHQGSLLEVPAVFESRTE
ncbi:MAG: Asp-tRNA(Asn)/Glu-tRNA(Gln) amidotransferase subunit GatC [Candidatus Uhrbacteria bacterium]